MYTAPKLPAVPAVIAVPSIVQALGVEFASSVATTTATILSAAAVPIEAPVYVAIVEDAATPAGFAVCEIATAILKKPVHDGLNP